MSKKFNQLIFEVATAKEKEEMKKGNPFSGYYGPSRKKTEEDKKLSIINKDDIKRLEKLKKSNDRSRNEIDKEEKAIKDHINKRKKLNFPIWFNNAKILNAKVNVDLKDKNKIIWEDGTWWDGTWKDGTWKDGNWHGGTWENGTWENGVWAGGTWKNGSWKRGEIWDPKLNRFIKSKVSPKEYFKK